MPSAEQIDLYYSSGEYRREVNVTAHPELPRDYDQPHAANYHEETERAKSWLPYLPVLVGSHLDVGASTGKVLEVIVASNHVGAEPGPWRRYYMSQVDLDSVDGKFVLVTIFHTLEHVVDPLRLLAGVRRLAIGLVCVEVPGPGQRLWPHLLDWSAGALLKAMSMSGLSARLVEPGSLKAVCDL
jgi:hypothetical protein